MNTRVTLGVILVCVLVLFGAYGRKLVEDSRKLEDERRAHQTTQNTAAGLDKAVDEKMREDARIDAGVARNENKRREIKRRDQAYREYLDRPLPAASLELYRDAAKAAAAERTGADAPSAVADEAD